MNHNFMKALKELTEMPDKLKAVEAERDLAMHHLRRLVNNILYEHEAPKDSPVYHTNEEGKKVVFAFPSHDHIRECANDAMKAFKND